MNTPKTYRVSYSGNPSVSRVIQCSVPLDAAKDFALQVPNGGENCKVVVAEAESASVVQEFSRQSGSWFAKQAIAEDGKAQGAHSFDEGGICLKCGCSTSAVKQFNFACNNSEAPPTRRRKKGTDLLGKVWLACLICLVLGFWIVASASEEVQKTAGIVGLTLICFSLVVFAVSMLIDYYSLPPGKREPATHSYSPRSTRYYSPHSNASRGGHYGKLTAAASLYAAGQLRQINQKLDQADSEGGSDFGGFL